VNNEEIRKLLGGYATNTLTESERSALFEAALDDQDLFNALQDEQALKELLADPASRQLIRHALEQSSASQRIAWWSTSTRWMLGGAIAAAVATLLIVAVIQQRRPQPEPARRVEVASNQEQAKPPLDQEAPKEPQKSPKPQPPPGRPLNGRSHDLIKLQPERPSEQPSPSSPQAQAEPPNNVNVETAPRAIGGVTGGVPTIVGSLRAPQEPLHYALLKRDAQGLYSAIPPETELRPGDTVRLNISPAASGYLSLEQLTPAGDWKRIYPESPQGLPVAANTAYTMPDNGIAVEDTAQKFRISLTLGESGPAAKQLDTGARQQIRAAAAPLAKETAPVTLEITIGPGKAP